MKKLFQWRILVVVFGAINFAFAGCQPSATEAPKTEASAATTPVSETEVSPSPASPVATPSMTASGVLAQAKLGLDRFGPVRVGMTVEEATRAGGVPLRLAGDSFGTIESGCAHVVPEGGPEGVGFMVVEGKIVRIDVWREGKVTTLSGAANGMTQAQIEALYPGKIEVTLHKYVGEKARYLTFVPQDRADSNYRLIFETNQMGRVVQFRAGQLPEVAWVEGCA